MALPVDDLSFVSRGDGIWSRCLPFRMLGAQFGRRLVVLERLGLRAVVTPPSGVRSIVEAEWGASFRIDLLIANTAFHDTYFGEAVADYPEAVSLVSGVDEASIPGARHLVESWPEAWCGVLDLYPIAGMPRVQETVIYDHANQTLVVGDLLFFFDERWDWWTRQFTWLAGMYGRPQLSRLFRACIRDRHAFRESLLPLLELPVRQILPTHGRIINENVNDVLQYLVDRMR